LQNTLFRPGFKAKIVLMCVRQ